MDIGSLALGTDGNLYGTTTEGGASGHGVVFQVTPQGALTVLHSFAITDGATPYAGLIRGTDGNFYGTTCGGGSAPFANGTAFKISSSGTFTTLYNFGHPRR